MFLHLSLRSMGVRVESKVPNPNSNIFFQGRFLFSLSENLRTPSCKYKISTWKMIKLEKEKTTELTLFSSTFYLKPEFDLRKHSAWYSSKQTVCSLHQGNHKQLRMSKFKATSMGKTFHQLFCPYKQRRLPPSHLVSSMLTFSCSQLKWNKMALPAASAPPELSNSSFFASHLELPLFSCNKEAH